MNPISLNQMKKKKYKNLDQLQADVDLLVENANEYNAQGSQIQQDALSIKVNEGQLKDN